MAKNSQMAPFNNPLVKDVLFSDEVIQGDHKISTGIDIDPKSNPLGESDSTIDLAVSRL